MLSASEDGVTAWVASAMVPIVSEGEESVQIVIVQLTIVNADLEAEIAMATNLAGHHVTRDPWLHAEWKAKHWARIVATALIVARIGTTGISGDSMRTTDSNGMRTTRCRDARRSIAMHATIGTNGMKRITVTGMMSGIVANTNATMIGMAANKKEGVATKSMSVLMTITMSTGVMTIVAVAARILAGMVVVVGDGSE